MSQAIDGLNEWVGRWVKWLVLASVLVSAFNAVIRYIQPQWASNAYLEMQWYLFAAVFLLGAGYTMLRQEHVRIDVILSRFSKPTQIKIEMFGIVAFLWPMCLLMIWLVWPLVVKAYVMGEVSSNAGGLIRWPLYALVPVSFVLLALQGLSELIKRWLFLKGEGPDPTQKQQAKTAEEELADVIRAREERAARDEGARA